MTANLRAALLAVSLPLVACGSGPETSDAGSASNTPAAARDTAPRLDAPTAPDTAPDYRALGQEPGWRLEIGHGRLHLLVDYGEREFEAPLTDAIVDATRGLRRYRTTTSDGHDITVVIEKTGCRDVMSGHPFPNTVTVTVDDRSYRGCGEPVRRPPVPESDTVTESA